MDIDEIKRHLHAHARLRMPVFDGDASARQKVAGLENYLADVAVARGDLEEARLWAEHVRHENQEEWDQIEGWELHVGGSAKKATGPQIMEAKRRIQPGLYDAIRETKWLVARLTDQIRRLEKDEEVASRRYTMLVGG